MINVREKKDIKEKVITVAQFSNILIKFSVEDASKEVAVMLQGMLKDLIKWIDELPTASRQPGGRTKGMKFKRIDHDEQEQEQEEEEEEYEEPKLSPMQVAARSFVNGGVSLSDANQQAYNAPKKEDGRRFNPGRAPGSKNKPR
jgi:hypothetical protein